MIPSIVSAREESFDAPVEAPLAELTLAVGNDAPPRSLPGVNETVVDGPDCVDTLGLELQLVMSSNREATTAKPVTLARYRSIFTVKTPFYLKSR